MISSLAKALLAFTIFVDNIQIFLRRYRAQLITKLIEFRQSNLPWQQALSTLKTSKINCTIGIRHCSIHRAHLLIDEIARYVVTLHRDKLLLQQFRKLSSTIFSCEQIHYQVSPVAVSMGKLLVLVVLTPNDLLML